MYLILAVPLNLIRRDGTHISEIVLPISEVLQHFHKLSRRRPLCYDMLQRKVLPFLYKFPTWSLNKNLYFLLSPFFWLWYPYHNCYLHIICLLYHEHILFSFWLLLCVVAFNTGSHCSCFQTNLYF